MEPTQKYYGTTKAARRMNAQDREMDLLALIRDHLAYHPLEDPAVQVDALRLLCRLDRRNLK